MCFKRFNVFEKSELKKLYFCACNVFIYLFIYRCIYTSMKKLCFCECNVLIH